MDRRSAELQFTINDPADKRRGALAIGDTYVLDGVSPAYEGSIAIQIELAGGFNGTFAVVARVPAGNTGIAQPWRQIPYIARYLNGALGTDATVTTTITAATIARVLAEGLEIALQLVAAPTAGTATVTACAVTRG